MAKPEGTALPPDGAVTGKIPAALLIATLASGTAALIYESLWTRSFALVLGSTMQASAVVFSSFLCGLALGAYLFSRLPLEGARVVRTYVLIEIGIALSGPLIGLALDRYRGELALLAGSPGDSLRIFRAMAAVLLATIVPTALLGGTLPVLLALIRRLRGDLVVVSWIYALNTAGAALGALVSGIYLIAALGISRSLLFAGALNALAALLAWASSELVSAQPGDGGAAGEAPEPASEAVSDRGAAALGAAGAGEPGPGRWQIPRMRLLLLGAAFTSGFLVLAVEVVWARLGSFFLGNRIYAVTFLLTWVLLLLAAGAALAGRLYRRFRAYPGELLAADLSAATGAMVIGTAAADWWVGRQAEIEASLPAIEQLLLVYRLLEVGILLGPTLLLLGCLFPTSLLCTEARVDETAPMVGRLYAVNTAGAVAGALITAWVGLPALGTPLWTVALAAAGALMALLLALLHPRLPQHKLLAYGIAAPFVIGLLGALLLPLELGSVRPGEKLVLRQEDEHGVFQLTQTAGGHLRATHNKTDLVFLLGAASTSFVQEMQGHLGVFYCPRARRGLVLGSGFGITAGALGLYPSLERIDAVEILPAMVEAADLFEPENHSYHKNPRVRVIVDDGRHYVTMSPETYDVISINVSDPHLPGSSGLFHRELYDIVKSRLTARGVLVQHVFGADADIILRTMGSAFPHVKLFPAYGNGVNVVAALHPLEVDLAALRPLLATPGVRRALEALGVAPPLTVEAMLAAAYERADFPALDAAAVPIATDDRPLLEYSTRGGQQAMLFSNE